MERQAWSYGFWELLPSWGEFSCCCRARGGISCVDKISPTESITPSWDSRLERAGLCSDIADSILSGSLDMRFSSHCGIWSLCAGSLSPTAVTNLAPIHICSRTIKVWNVFLGTMLSVETSGAKPSGMTLNGLPSLRPLHKACSAHRGSKGWHFALIGSMTAYIWLHDNHWKQRATILCRHVVSTPQDSFMEGKNSKPKMLPALLMHASAILAEDAKLMDMCHLETRMQPAREFCSKHTQPFEWLWPIA